MKLCATIQSERGKIVQKTGNDFLYIAVTVGEDHTQIIYINVSHEEKNGEHIYRLWNGDVLVDKIIEKVNVKS